MCNWLIPVERTEFQIMAMRGGISYMLLTLLIKGKSFMKQTYFFSYGKMAIKQLEMTPLLENRILSRMSNLNFLNIQVPANNKIIICLAYI